MKKYTKKEMEAMTTLEQEIKARLFNLNADRLEIVEIVEWVKSNKTKNQLWNTLIKIYDAIEEAKELVKEVE
jgi:hypothetical protein